MILMKMSISDENNFYICFKIEELLFGKRMSIEDIQQHLKTKENIYIATKDLYKYIYILHCNYKRIIRRDYWDSNPEFEGLDKYYWDSSYQRNFYSFEQKSKNSITFLLMSDTHIGNAQFFDCKLLNAIYDYAIGKGATRCFLLGDLFDGNKNASLLDQDELERQINIFADKFPNDGKLLTYCLLGNHDIKLNEYLEKRNWWNASDLRELTTYNNNFQMIPRHSFSSNVNDVNIHFSHYLYMSIFFKNLKINSLEDIEKAKMIFGNLVYDPNYDFLISGHLHKGVIYTSFSPDNGDSNLYLGVPSTSSININGVVAFIVTLNENQVAEITALSCDSNYNISESFLFSYTFNKENKSFMKVL